MRMVISLVQEVSRIHDQHRGLHIPLTRQFVSLDYRGVYNN